MRALITIAILLALAVMAGAQDQPVRPVLIDENDVIIHPNPHLFAEANNIVMTTDALYGFLTNATLVSAATGAVSQIAALDATITNLPAASITSGNIEAARLTNAISSIALVPNELSVTNVFVDAESKTNTIVISGGQIVSWTVTTE